MTKCWLFFDLLKWLWLMFSNRHIHWAPKSLWRHLFLHFMASPVTGTPRHHRGGSLLLFPFFSLSFAFVFGFYTRQFLLCWDLMATVVIFQIYCLWWFVNGFWLYYDGSSWWGLVWHVRGVECIRGAKRAFTLVALLPEKWCFF